MNVTDEVRRAYTQGVWVWWRVVVQGEGGGTYNWECLVFWFKVRDLFVNLITQPISQDTTASSLARKFKADLVITSGALKALIDNQDPDYKEQWELPVCVQQLRGTVADLAVDQLQSSALSLGFLKLRIFYA